MIEEQSGRRAAHFVGSEALRYLHIGLAALVYAMACCSLAFAQDTVAPAPPDAIHYGQAKQLAALDNPVVKESSGLAWDRLNQVLWTHNDSGSGPTLWAFDLHGKQVMQLTIAKAASIDWEDICSFQLDGKNYLLIGDTGDNDSVRHNCALYLIETPDIAKAQPLRGLTVEPTQVIRFEYDDKPHDCEAIAVDPATRSVILISKELGFWCAAYSLKIPDKPTNQPQTARKLARVEATVVTAMDISPDGRRAILCTYTEALEFTRIGSATWADAFDEEPRSIALPARRQGESICYGADGKTLYLTSEGLPTPLWEVPPVAADKATAPQ